MVNKISKILLICLLTLIILSNNSSAQIITTIAGNGDVGYMGDGGLATNARLNVPEGVFVDISGNVYIADRNNNRIRKVNSSTGIISTIAGSGIQGYAGDGGLATNAQLNSPICVFIDAFGNVYIADSFNNVIRKINSSTGIICTIAGNGTYGFSGDGGLATSAQLCYPYGVCVDDSNNVYISDGCNTRIRKITASSGIITTIAGNGTYGNSGDGGQATSAQLNYPSGIAIDVSGNVYIVNEGNSSIRKVSYSTGIISTIAGNGSQGYSGDGGLATNAQLNSPYGIAIDDSSNVYIADRNNNRIRKVNTFTGIISTIAGNGTYGYSGDGGIATNAELYYPTGVSVDVFGKIYIADRNNNRIRKVTYSTDVPLNGNNMENNLKIFPNPFSTQTTIQTDKVSKDATLTLYNLYGQQIKQIINIVGQTITLHRENLPSGIYFIRLTQNNKAIATDKILITDN